MQQESIEQFLDALIDLARRMLESLGEFIPLGAYIDPQQQMQLCAMLRDDDIIDIGEYKEALTRMLRDGLADGSMQMAGLCLNVTVMTPSSPEKRDAIFVAIENAEGERFHFYQPYKLNDGVVEFAEPFLGANPPIFAVNRGANN